ncbi:3',5'-cyclic-nucleotide phosphodiesterase regA [Choanephora cucurbitarum]|uniref:Phosphodiesterase n=1 Tax=Choanephora cucurbitarum TaxID=101091 RepID=A0A1C7N3U6_9FUNG|nr:3',5'-cyclic-nucleotide phosphodiesterase regA [Choanephora cucurbitarum]
MTDIKDIMTIHSPTIVFIHIDHDFTILKEICQWIQFNPNIMPIACSQNDSASLRIECSQIGACDFILKPFCEAVIKTVVLNVYQQSTVWSTFQDRLDKFYGKEWLSSPHVHLPNLSIDILSSERKQHLDQSIYRWDFSPLAMDERELIYCAITMLQQTFAQFPTELRSLQLTQSALYDFVFDVYHLYYNTNPYHNFRHAIDVMQSTWYFFCSIGLLRKKPNNRASAYFRHSFHHDSISHLLRPVDILALLMASLGHDVGHPGVNNGFMVNTASPLALLYNDTSVLESYHCMTFLNLLRKHYFKSMVDIKSQPEYKTFRKIIAQGILCTDMGCHHDYVDRIKHQIEKMKANHRVTEKERLVLCSAIIKCADISNCARPFHQAREWAMILSEEFYRQGDLERELGITPSPIHSRGQLSLADSQLSFIHNVALELFSHIEQLFPTLDFCTKHIHHNLERWANHIPL